MTTEEHLNRILETCRANLALAEKRTPGKWAYYASRVCSESEYHDAAQVDNVDVCHEIDWRDSEPKQKTIENLTYIAACAGSAEAGWKTTILLVEIARELGNTGWGKASTAGLIAAWPEELFK